MGFIHNQHEGPMSDGVAMIRHAYDKAEYQRILAAGDTVSMADPDSLSPLAPAA